MNQNVELTAESLAGPGKSSVELLIVLHVTWKDRGAGYLGGQVAHVLLHAILVGKGEVSAFASKRLGDSPANGTMIGNTENKCVFSFKQGHFFLLLCCCSSHCMLFAGVDACQQKKSAGYRSMG